MTGTANLLANPSFEGGYYSCVRPEGPAGVYHCSESPENGVLVQEIDVPNYWTFHYWLGSISPYTGEHVAAQPEARITDRRFPARVKDGGHAYKVYATWHTYAFALSQQVKLETAGTLTPCVAFHFWLAEEGKAGLHPNGNPRSEFESGAQVCVSAITPSGITQECGLVVDEYQDLCAPPLLVYASPENPTEVVFRVTAGVSRPCRNNDVYLDDARLLFSPAAEGYPIWTAGGDTASSSIALTALVSATAPITAVTPTPAPIITPSPTPSPTPTPTPAPRIGVTPLPVLSAPAGEVGWRGYLVRAGDLPFPTPTPTPEEKPARQGPKAKAPPVLQMVMGGALLIAFLGSLFKDRLRSLLRR